MFRGSGTIIYDPHRPGVNSKWWCVLEIDSGNELVRYYRWWIDKTFLNPIELPNNGLKSQSWPAHISVVRGEQPKEEYRHLWKKYHKQKVEFEYDFVSNFKIGKNNKGKEPGVFYIVEVKCPLLTEIRKEFGLKYDWPLHLTFGRTRK